MRAQIVAFLRAGGDFEQTALQLYRWQRAHNTEYDRFCGAAQPTRWEDIPAVPASLFRDLFLTCFDPAAASVCFETSGTTAGRPGRVRLLDTEVYDLSARLHAERCLGLVPPRAISLVPTDDHSSLGHMCRHLSPETRPFFSSETGVDAPGAWAALRAATAPVFVPTTALALVDLLAHGHDPVALPEGSILMLTGGFKGRRRAVDPEDLLQRLSRHLPGCRIVGEYGMSELSSQLWAVPAGERFVPPPWLRVLAVDPWTGTGQTSGQLRFFDLANHQTVLAIETGDQGTVHPDGSVTLEGRLPGARPRGCSLSVEEARAR